MECRSCKFVKRDDSGLIVSCLLSCFNLVNMHGPCGFYERHIARRYCRDLERINCGTHVLVSDNGIVWYKKIFYRVCWNGFPLTFADVELDVDKKSTQWNFLKKLT